MRIFALSDIHVDFDANFKWIRDLSPSEFIDDVLILAGDVSHMAAQLRLCLETLTRKFRKVLYIPGNHDLWVIRDPEPKTSLDKFAEVVRIATESGASMERLACDGFSIVPLLSWYDYSFGMPSEALKSAWMDFYACRWPKGFEAADVAAHFAGLNDLSAPALKGMVITFSHFLPRIDIMLDAILPEHRRLFPVLGTTRLDVQLRALGAKLHIYGHSHFQRRVQLDGVTYVNNALGYPHETWIASRGLLCVHKS